MQIVVHLSSYYEFKPFETEPTKEELNSLDVIHSLNAGPLKRTLVEADTYTDINIPEHQIIALVEHYLRLGRAKNPNQIIASYLDSEVMPQHAPQSSWKYIEVPGNLELETFLNMYFGLNKENNAK